MNWKNRLLHKFRYKITHASKFPKGNLTSCLLNLAVRGFNPRYAIDVGANRGKWSRDARAVFPDCQITLIEPQIEMKKQLDRFCRRHKGCRWLLAGAGAEPGELRLTVCPDLVSSSFKISQQAAQAAGYEQRLVPIVTLDHVAQHVIGAIPDLVKVDAEGFESEVLQGSKSLIGKTELFFLEAHLLGDGPNPSGIVELVLRMHEYGYAPYDFTWFGKRPYDGAIGLCEIAFARQGGMLRSFDGWERGASASCVES